MSVPFIIVSGLFIIGCIVLVAVILMQDERNAGGLGMGNTSAPDTHYNRNRSRAMEHGTKFGALVLAVIAVILCLI